VDPLPDRYDALEAISSNGRVELIKAWDRVSQRHVAMKVIQFNSEREHERLIAATRIVLAAEPHPNIATLQSDLTLDNRYIVVMDWIDGTDLGRCLMSRGDPGLPVRDVVNYIGQAAKALDHLHSRDPAIVHGDVKPSNLMLTPDSSVVLVDFGLTQIAGIAHRAGTRGFLAPEVGAGRELTPGTDVYALAATAVALLTGRPPDQKRPLLEDVEPGEVARLLKALRRGLSTDPAGRPATAGELARLIRTGEHALRDGVLTFLVVQLRDYDTSWDTHASEMSAMLDRLDEVVSNCVERSDGRAMSSMSVAENRWAVFRDANAAVEAAVRLHETVTSDLWIGDSPASIAIGIDTGLAQIRGGGYEGPVVVNAARIASAVPPGQTALSGAVADLARARLPLGTDLVALADGLIGLVPLGVGPYDLITSHDSGADGPKRVWIVASQLDVEPERDDGQVRRDTDRWRSILAEACTRSSGRVLSMDRDVSILLFGRASSAVEAAVSAAKAFDSSGDTALGVRASLSIHVEPTIRRAKLEAPVTTHTCRAICRATHPGQILVSQAAYEEVHAAMPADASMLSLGSYRLSDLSRPQLIYQYVAPSTVRDFPPPRSIDNRPHNLPVELNRFIGRRAELVLLAEQITQNRLTTVTGPAGVGKSRLAVQAAAQTLIEFTDGVWICDVGRHGRSGDLATVLLSTLGVGDRGSGTYLGRVPDHPDLAAARLFDHLRAQRALIVLDNCDGEISDVRLITTELLRRCPGLHVLATSWEPLGLEGERLMRLQPLDVPAPDEPPDVARVRGAVRLFIDQALQGRSDLPLDNRAIAAIAKICRAVDGLPLAIKLVAARAKHESLMRIATTVYPVSSMSHDSPSDLDGTFGDPIVWTYRRLDEREQAVLRGLSVFAGGFSMAAAQQVLRRAERLDPRTVQEWVLDLADKSLVEVDLRSNADRYRLLEVTRRFAERELQSSVSGQRLRAAHLEWCEAFSREAAAGLTGADQADWLERVDAEYDNLKEACSRPMAVARGTDLAIGARLGLFWLMSGRVSEGRSWLDGALDHERRNQDSVLAEAWASSGLLACFAGDTDQATTAVGRALMAADSADNPWLRARATAVFGLVVLLQRLPELAVQYNEAAVALAAEVGDLWLVGFAETNLGNAYLLIDDLDRARARYERALENRRARDDQYGLAWTLLRLGVLATVEGDAEQARSFLTEALDCAASIQYRAGSLLASIALGDLQMLAGRNHAAAELYRRSLEIARSVDDEAAASLALGGLVRCAAAEGRGSEAADWLSEQEAAAGRAGLHSMAALLQSRAAVAHLQGFEAAAAGHHRGALLIWRHLRDTGGVMTELEALSLYAEVFGDRSGAALLLGATDKLRERMAAPQRIADAGRIDHLRRTVDESTDQDVQQAYRRGRTLGPDEVMAAAMGVMRG